MRRSDRIFKFFSPLIGLGLFTRLRAGVLQNQMLCIGGRDVRFASTGGHFGLEIRHARAWALASPFMRNRLCWHQIREWLSRLDCEARIESDGNAVVGPIFVDCLLTAFRV